MRGDENSLIIDLNDRAGLGDCFHCFQVVGTIDMHAAQPRNKVAQTLHNMTLRIIAARPSITQAIKHIHIEIKCKHEFGFNLIEIRHLSVEHYVCRVWHAVPAITYVTSYLCCYT